MIPKVIHYCWFGGNPLPADVRGCIKSWEEKCPEYKIIRWDESNFDVNAHPFTKAAYQAKAWAFVSDYARIKIVNENGGFYLDTDVELLKNLDFLCECKCYLGIQQSEHLCNTGLGFGAEKGTDILCKILKKYDDIEFSINNRFNIACPYINSSVLYDLGYCYDPVNPVKIAEVLVLPPKYLDPIAPGKGMINLKCEETISIHHYSATWMGTGKKIRRKIIRFIGQENINKIKKNWILQKMERKNEN